MLSAAFSSDTQQSFLLPSVCYTPVHSAVFSSDRQRRLPFTLLALMQDIASMAFSPDGRLLAAQGGAPEWNLVLWVWEKSKVVTSVKTTNAAGNPVYQVSLYMNRLDY